MMKIFKEYYIGSNKDSIACLFCIQNRNDALENHSACIVAPIL